jgi:hypothetical protein
MVAPHAGLPLLLPPLSGNRREAQDCGEVIGTHVRPWQPTDGLPDLAAARAL